MMLVLGGLLRPVMLKVMGVIVEARQAIQVRINDLLLVVEGR